MICDPWDVVVVPFPFSDRGLSKRRPALVLTAKGFNRHGHTVLAMITSSSHSPWPGDVALTSRAEAGLDTPCLVRLKLFTLDNRLILKKIGRLGSRDRAAVQTQLDAFLSPAA